MTFSVREEGKIRFLVILNNFRSRTLSIVSKYDYSVEDEFEKCVLKNTVMEANLFPFLINILSTCVIYCEIKALTLVTLFNCTIRHD